MTDPSPTGPRRSTFAAMVGAKTARKLRSRSNPESVWFGLGMMGLVGWSVVVPTLLGTALGFWLDRSASGEHSWTIALLFVGLAIGCLNAWYWVAKEDRAIREQTRGDDA